MWSGAILGLVQGLSEFLPISSSGHLVLLRALLGWHTRGASLEIGLHAGTLIAIVAAYGRRWRQWSANGRRLALVLLWASLPAAALGLAAGPWFQQWFTPRGAAWGWAATTVALWLTPQRPRARARLDTLSPGAALWVGCFQAAALWPGLSRSGSTIFAARLLGLDGEEATALAFFLAVPVTLGAMGLEAWHNGFGPWLHPAVALGMAISAISGWFAVQWVRASVSTPWWRRFAVYTAILALVGWRLGG